MPLPSILIIDDEPDIRELLAITVTKMGFDVATAESVASAKQAFSGEDFALCLTDLKLPDGSGIEFVEYVQRKKSEVPVIVITAHGSTDSAVNAMKSGAFDFISKPVDLSHLRRLIEQAISSSSSPTESNIDSLNYIIGKSHEIKQLKEKIIKVARSQAPVYISGESGSGKELVAQAIHRQSARKDASFVGINCGAIPSELMESEFFGHKKGSFTNAHQDKAGFFKSAQGGTLFLDEVADLPLSMQVKLLRTLQEKSIRPIGSEKEELVDVRIICATHKNLQKEVEEKRFRSDLFYRLNVININVAPLRERKEDLPLLIDYLISKINDEHGLSIKITQAAIKKLESYHFPGNIRELDNILERAATLCDNNTIDQQDLSLEQTQFKEEPLASSSQAQSHINEFNYNETIDDYLNAIEKNIIVDALEKNRWNRTNTAKSLGISFRSLRYRLKKLGLDD